MSGSTWIKHIHLAPPFHINGSLWVRWKKAFVINLLCFSNFLHDCSCLPFSNRIMFILTCHMTLAIFPTGSTNPLTFVQFDNAFWIWSKVLGVETFLKTFPQCTFSCKVHLRWYATRTLYEYIFFYFLYVITSRWLEIPRKKSHSKTIKFLIIPLIIIVSFNVFFLSIGLNRREIIKTI